MVPFDFQVKCGVENPVELKQDLFKLRDCDD